MPAAIALTQTTQRIVAIARHLEEVGSAMVTMCSHGSHADRSVIPRKADKYYSSFLASPLATVPGG